MHPTPVTAATAAAPETATLKDMTYPFIVAVNGVSFRQEAVRKVRPNDEVVLAHQPDNPHDPNAVAVYSKDGEHLGYLPAKVAARIPAQEGLAGEVVEVLTGETWGLRIRVRSTAGAVEMRPATFKDGGRDHNGAGDGRSGRGGGESRANTPKVYAKSGRMLGHLAGYEDGRVMVAKPDGAVVRFPVGVVVVEGGDSLGA